MIKEVGAAAAELLPVLSLSKGPQVPVLCGFLI
jgi:hypothetical protein